MKKKREKKKLNNPNILSYNYKEMLKKKEKNTKKQTRAAGSCYTVFF